MESFKIEGKNGYILVCILEVYGFPNSTSFAGGYDVKGTAEVKVNNYSASGELWFSTGEIYNFFTALKKCYEGLNGNAEILTTERNLKLDVHFEKLGHAVIKGEYIERLEFNNMLIFEIMSDQSYLQETINELSKIIKNYGGLKGIKEGFLWDTMKR
jgi:hypothetical protein